MATVNNRVMSPQGLVINGVDAGGAMTVNVKAGNDQTNKSAPDGLAVPVKDKEMQYVRGTVVTQDWVHAVELLTAVVGDLVFYERKSNIPAANGYIKHTIANPVIHRMQLRFNRKGYATATFNFECRAADETKGIIDMWSSKDNQSAPTYISAARGGVRILSATHGTVGTLISILHNTDFEFSIEMRLAKESNDADVGYTCVDAMTDGMTCRGSIGFQDAAIAADVMLIQKLITAAKGPLVITVRQSQGATSKVITIANVDFDSNSSNSSATSDYTGYTLDYDVANIAGTPLTLEGDNKIIEITDLA